MNEETVRIIAISRVVARNRNLQGMVKDAMEADEKRTFSTVMPNGMRIVGHKVNALMYKLGYEVRGKTAKPC